LELYLQHLIDNSSIQDFYANKQLYTTIYKLTNWLFTYNGKYNIIHQKIVKQYKDLQKIALKTNTISSLEEELGNSIRELINYQQNISIEKNISIENNVSSSQEIKSCITDEELFITELKPS